MRRTWPEVSESRWWGFRVNRKFFLAATKQLIEHFCLSVCLSVCLLVCLLHLFHYFAKSQHSIIMKFSGVITNDKRDVHTKGQGQRSKVKAVFPNGFHATSADVISERLQGHRGQDPT